jgi:hypothetical protein
MRLNILLITVFLALALPAPPQTNQEQKDGAAQTVGFDTRNRATLQFAAKNEKLDCCGIFVSHTVLDNEEEALAIRVDHAHRQGWGAISFPERGWLYITATRIIFVVEEGDRSHGFDLPRTAMQAKAGSQPKVDWSMNKWSGIQINLNEKLQPSNTREQKFSFISWQNSKCREFNLTRMTEFIEQVVNDFPAALAEFKQSATTLKEAGKVQQSAPVVLPPADPIKLAAEAKASLRKDQAKDQPGSKQANTVTTGVEIKSKPDAQVYIDGNFQSTKDSSKIPLSAGEHTVRLIRCGYKTWEQKITVEDGMLIALKPALEKL